MELQAPTGYIFSKTNVNFHLEPGATRELAVKNTRDDGPEKLGALELTYGAASISQTVGRYVLKEQRALRLQAGICPHSRQGD